MKRHVYIAPQSISTDEKTSFPVDTSFWKPLWSMLSKKAVAMEIHCWIEEVGVAKQLEEKMVNKGQVPGTETLAFSVDLTDGMVAWMATESYDKRGGLRWFSIFLYDSFGESVGSIGHYGGEIVFYPENEEEKEEVKSFFKGEFVFHLFE